jgi:hypothetical protein
MLSKNQGALLAALWRCTRLNDRASSADLAAEIAARGMDAAIVPSGLRFLQRRGLSANDGTGHYLTAEGRRELAAIDRQATEYDLLDRVYFAYRMAGYRDRITDAQRATLTAILRDSPEWGPNSLHVSADGEVSCAIDEVKAGECQTYEFITLGHVSDMVDEHGNRITAHQQQETER